MSDIKQKINELKEVVSKKGKEALDTVIKEVNMAYSSIDEGHKNYNEDNYEVKKAILDKIKEYECIIIHRHIRPDGDAIGSSHGLKALLKNSFPTKEVYVASSDNSEYLSWVAKDDIVSKEKYQNALVIVVDTGNESRISGENYKLGKEIIKIDHHETSNDFGVINYCLPKSASCANMIVDFALTFRMELKLCEEAAKYLYIGIVTDSGRFRFASVDEKCMKEAASLLAYNINIEDIYTHLYVDDEEKFALKKYVYSNYKLTKNGVAYIYFKDNYGKKHGGISKEDISSTISLLDCIKGSMIWVLFNEGEDSTRVRLRSRYISLTKLAEKYHGGGHENACGATVYSKGEAKRLLEDADKLLKEFKANNKDLF